MSGGISPAGIVIREQGLYMERINMTKEVFSLFRICVTRFGFWAYGSSPDLND